MRLSHPLEQHKAAFMGFWMARDKRERTMLTAAALVIILGLVYSILIDPALNGRTQLSKNLPVLRQQLAQMQSLANEAKLLTSKPAVPTNELTKENIEAALARYSLKAQNVSVTGNYAKVQLSSSSFSGVLNWLSEMQSTMKISVTDANIIALDQPDTVNATFTLRQFKNE